MSVDPSPLTRQPVTVLKDFDYVFSENGLNAFKDGETLAVQVAAIANPRQQSRSRALCTLPLSIFHEFGT